jgi:putative ABC transport system permease protein
MILNYLKIAYRQFRKQKMYAAIKIGGFALGIAACLLIALYIRDETGYDRSYPDADRIFRLEAVEGWKGADWPLPMSAAIGHDFPEVAYSGCMAPNWGIEVRRADQAQNTYEQFYMYADQSFLDIFHLPMVSGDGRTALTEPLTMVISKSMADRYFHGRSPIGEAMYLDNDKAHPYRITAVMADIPANSHLHPFNFILTQAGKEFWPGEATNWGAANHWVYIKLKAGTDAAAFTEKLTAGLIKNHFLPEWIKGGTKDAEKEAKKFRFFLLPVKDINLYSYNMPDGLQHGDIRFIRLFGAIGAFILIIACINFINLSTA